MSYGQWFYLCILEWRAFRLFLFFWLWQTVLLWTLLYLSVGAHMLTSLRGMYVEVEFLGYRKCCHILLQSVVCQFIWQTVYESSGCPYTQQTCSSHLILAVCAWCGTSLWFLLCTPVVTNEIKGFSLRALVILYILFCEVSSQEFADCLSSPTLSYV